MEADESVSFSCDFNDEGLSETESRASCQCNWDAALASDQRGIMSVSEGYSTASGGSDSFSISECEQCNGVKVDSLTLALRELRSGQPAANFFKAHEQMCDSGKSSYEFLELQNRPAKRSSSLKTKKTPPGTPNQMKKAVRFADAFGLDLTLVRHVFDLENPPVIPPQATRHLNLPESEDDDSRSSSRRSSVEVQPKFIVSPRFAQPGDSLCFRNRVAAQKVVLERATVSDNTSVVQGRVLVANIGFEKEVTVRASNDNWSSVQEVSGVYDHSSCDGATDQFRFELLADFGPQRTLTFCIRYRAAGETFWDNNFGENYTFDCYTVNSVGGSCR